MNVIWRKLLILEMDVQLLCKLIILTVLCLVHSAISPRMVIVYLTDDNISVSSFFT